MKSNIQKTTAILFAVLFLSVSAAFAQNAQPDNNVEQAAGQSTSTVTASARSASALFSPDHTLTVMGNADKTGGGSWAVFSDERLKTVKGRFIPGLKALMQLQPLRYEYKPDNALGLKSSGEHIGFSAQAVQRVVPEAVTTNDKGYLLVNNDPILWTMLNAIKEQQNQIETLRTRNAALSARLRSVEKSLRKKGGSAKRRR